MRPADLYPADAASLFLDGEIGRDVRKHHRQVRQDEASCVGAIWDKADVRRGRKSICQALRIDPEDPAAYWSTHPFRIVDHGGTWIAGAIGAPPLKDAKRIGAWSPLEITDVILWNPRTNALRLADDSGAALVTPQTGDEITVYADGYSFFRAWADLRSEMMAYARDTTPHALPGALLIGDIAKVSWMSLGATVLKAGPGVDAAKLKSTVFRQAHIPRVAAA